MPSYRSINRFGLLPALLAVIMAFACRPGSSIATTQVAPAQAATIPAVTNQPPAPAPTTPPQTASAGLPCPVFPADNIWNTPIDYLPTHPLSDEYIDTIGRDVSFHPDFGSGIWPPEDGGPIGIPFVVVPAAQPQVSVDFYYPDESDPGPYPIPPNPPIEGGPDSDGDRHILIVQEGSCLLYELYDAYQREDGGWDAGSGAVFDLRSNVLRPDGWTSADAAGLPILPGLVRYDEVVAGEISHALRFTAPETQRAYVWPARHFASDLLDEAFPPMGQRFRLRANYDISGFDPHVQVILRAMQRYGIILADNGSPWYISGAPDERWDNDVLRQLDQLTGDDFEAVDVSGLMLDPDSGQAASFDETAFIPTVTAATR
jgi:hypothetical protein